MTATAQQRWSQRQFVSADWDDDGAASSENYFPEPLTVEQRTRLPDISSQPAGIHIGGGGPRRGRLVTFYRNGDPHFKGLSASISQKAFISMESLLVWLNEKIPTTAGVRHIFRLPDGRRVREVSEFQPGGHYVVSSVRRLLRGPDYGGEAAAAAGPAAGGDPQSWQHQHSSVAGLMRPADIRLLGRAADRQSETGHQPQQPAGRYRRSPLDGSTSIVGAGRGVRLITVVSNTHRNSREKVLVNPGTGLNFEDLLADFTSLLAMSGPPVRTLYTASPPYRRIESFSQLFREFTDHDTFIACGRELTPVELNGVAAASPAATKLSRRADEDWQVYD